MRLLNESETGRAAEVLRQFTRALTRHLYVEDEVLTPVLGAGGATGEAASTMQREHAEIAAQLQLIEDSLRAVDAGAGETGSYCAILSGTLAKHEYREENNLFPRWRGAWTLMTAAEQAEMMSRAQKLLGEG